MASSILRKLFGAYFAPKLPDQSEFASIEQDIRVHAERSVAEGFDEREALCENVRGTFEDDTPESVLSQIPHLIDSAIAAHRRAQQTWPTVTDCDKLDAAFAALEDEGIVARHHFACCGTCGVAEIGDEIDAALARGVPVTGYTFYHMQDTESAVAGGRLYLNYGSLEDVERSCVGVGRRIVEVLQASGLQTDWDGSLSKRIGVTLDWKRRRTD